MESGEFKLKFNLTTKLYAQKKVLNKCVFCKKYKASKQGKRNNRIRFKCLNCGLWFVKGDKNSNQAEISLKQILLDHLDGVSFRNLVSRHGSNKNKLCEITNNQISKFKDNFEITKQFLKQLKYTGNLVVDGKCIPVKETIKSIGHVTGKIPRSSKRRRIKKAMVVIWGADYSTHDMPHYEFGESENGFVFDNYFRKLKSINYPLKSLTADDRREIVLAAERHYPDCVVQLCARHYITKVSRTLTISNIKIKINAKQNQIDELFVDDNSAYIPTTRFYSIKRAVKLSNEIAEMEFKYELLIDFQNIVDSIIFAGDYRTARIRIASLEKYFWPKRFAMREYFPKEHIRIVKKLFSDFKDHKEYLLNYLKYPRLNIPRTTNLIEGYNSQLELRLASIKGFETFKTARNYINVWIIKRRFSKFSDCKNHFKKLNGKTPLECAGADISNIRDWIKWCQNGESKSPPSKE